MNVTSARYRVDASGYGHLELMVDGLLADLDMKRTLLNRGYVFLGSDWESLVEAPNNHDLNCSLKGFTTDPVIIKLAREYVAGHYKPGRIPVPSVEEAQQNPGPIF